MQLFIYREAHHHKPEFKIERVTEPYGLSEGPHWDHNTQKLYFVDIYNQYIRRLDPATGVVTSTHLGKSTPFFASITITYNSLYL